jgi:HTH-type transcriptional regulator/antitoxin HigA
MKWDKLISTEKEYEQSLARLSKIFEADPVSAEGMEAALLVLLIEEYEKEHYPISLPDPIVAVKETMERKGLKDKDLIPYIGSKTTVSLVLTKKRGLTIDMIRNLSKGLNLPVELLIQPYALEDQQKNEFKSLPKKRMAKETDSILKKQR